MDLKAAAIAGNKDAVKFWLHKGTDVNAPDTLGRTPLSWAAQHGHEAIVQLFLDNPGVVPNFLDDLGRSPLSWAAQFGHDAVVKHILARLDKDGIIPECDSPDKFGRTPLFLTAGGRPSELVPDHSDLIRFGDMDAWEPGPNISKIDRVTVARLLLEAGANPELTDMTGETPMDWAESNGQRELVKLYLQRLVNLYVQESTSSNHGGDAARLLFLAMKHGHDEEVSNLLSSVTDIDPNAKNHSGETLLCFALENHYGTVATTLLQHPNIDPNIKNRSGETPLCLAIKMSLEARVKDLLTHPKIDPNMKDNSGRTPLFVAVPRRAIDILREVLQHPKIDPNVKSISGKTPLSRAAELGNYPSARELLQHEKTDRNTIDDSGQTPLLLATKSRAESVVRELLLYPEVDCSSQDNNGCTPIWVAIQTGCVEVAKLLFRRMKISPDFRNQSGQTPLSYAARYGHKDLVEFLLMDETVDPDSKDENGCTPLFLAVLCGDEETVKVLLDPEKNRGKITLNSKNNAGSTPLSYAAHCGDVRVVGLLLETGCVEPDTPTHDGRTPLSLAAENGHQKVMELLTQRGANPNFKDNDGRTPLAWAIERISDADVTLSVVSQLLIAGAGLDSKDIENQMLLQRVVGKGFDRVALKLLSEMKLHDRTPLSWAAETGNETIVNFLLTQDVTDVDSEDMGGRTALWRAADSCREPVVKLLAPKDNATLPVLVQEGNELGVRCMLDAGCEVNMRDSFDRTLLHVAALHGQHRLLEDIIKAGVGINTKDIDGKTPIRLAVEEEETETIKVLLKFSAETELIMADQWSQAYKDIDPNAIHPHAIHLLQRESGAEALRFFGKSVDLEMVEVGNAELRQILYITPPLLHQRSFTNFKSIFANFSPWTSHWIPNFEWKWPHGPTATSTTPKFNLTTPRQGSHSSDRYLFSEETKKDNQQWTTFTLVALAPSGEPKHNDKFLENEAWERLAITWTMVPLRSSQRTSGWKSIDHFSMLRIGWIPKDNVEFVTHFVSSLNEKWLHLCDRANEHLARRRADQLEKKGLSDKLINHLAEDALAWTQLRSILKDQIHALDTFASGHCRRYSNKKGLKDMQEIVRNFSEAVGTRLDALDQTVRDLLQLEFAWVSVVEAHRSTSLSMSMKRLSWITFIFLPPMFAASLFGMNVDVLASNPDWRWYPLFGVAFLLVTLAGWLTFKSVEPKVEQGLIRIGAKFDQRFGKGRLRTGSVSDIEMNPFK